MPCLSSSIRRVFGAWRRKAGDEESAPQGIELSEVWVEPIIEPPESYECDAKCGHIPNGEVLILCVVGPLLLATMSHFANRNRGDGGVTIKIVVGRPPERTTFVAHKSLLRQHSEYFATALKDGNEDRFIEADRGVFEWPDDDPEQVRRWVRWLYTCRNCQRGDPYNSAHICKSGSELDRDPNSWCAPDVESELAYLLGDRLLSPGYCRFALGFFIQHVHLIEPDRILWAHERLPERSSLRRFVHAWLSWMNYRLDTGMKMTADERAAARALSYGWVAIDGSRTNDPRKYLPEHWSEPCSLHSNRLCNHERAHWFWRRSANGQPVSRCPTITRRITPDRRAACVGALVLLVSCRLKPCAVPVGTP